MGCRGGRRQVPGPARGRDRGRVRPAIRRAAPDRTARTQPLQASAAEILDRAASIPHARIRALILEVAGGNPLALLELPRTMTAADDAIDADRLPLTRRLERSFAARIGDLDEMTRTALDLAALSDSGDLAEIVAATQLVAGTAATAALDPAASAGLIKAAEQVAGPHHFAAADAVILVARAALTSGQGQHELAFSQLARLHDPGDPAHHPVHGLWSLASLAEAAAFCGEADAAAGFSPACDRRSVLPAHPARRSRSMPSRIWPAAP